LVFGLIVALLTGIMTHILVPVSSAMLAERSARHKKQGGRLVALFSNLKHSRVYDMTILQDQDPQIAQAIQNEIGRQRATINLIASENYASKAVMEAQGSVMTNKYAEGYPGRRYYGGCEFVDVAEQIAIERADGRKKS